MRTRRLFQPTLDEMSTRIAPSSVTISLPVVGAAMEQPSLPPVVVSLQNATNMTDPNDPTDPPK